MMLINYSILSSDSPCYISKDSDLRLVSRRVAWGKFANAGQVTNVRLSFYYSYALKAFRLLHGTSSSIYLLTLQPSDSIKTNVRMYQLHLRVYHK
jgi:hypothetical protein